MCALLRVLSFVSVGEYKCFTLVGILFFYFFFFLLTLSHLSLIRLNDNGLHFLGVRLSDARSRPAPLPGSQDFG